MADLLDELASYGVIVKLRRGELEIDTNGVMLPSSLGDALSSRKEELRAAIGDASGATGPVLVADGGAATDFPLTDLQSAYVVGELGGLELTTPAFVAHAYEAHCLDVNRLRGALVALLQRHEMLRVVLTTDGRQAVRVPEMTPTPLEVVDCTGLDAVTVRTRFEERWRRFGEAVPPLAQGPQLACLVFQGDDVNFVLIVMRLFVLDARSLAVVQRDLAQFYAEGVSASTPLAPGLFGQYLDALDRHRGTQSYRNAVAYWQRRGASLPPGPTLPLATAAAAPAASRFVRRQHRLPRQDWARLQERARTHGLTANALLCGCYAEILRRWSGSASPFSLTVLASTRTMVFGPGDEALADAVGNYGTTFLLESDGRGTTLLERIQRIQSQMFADLPNCLCSGVKAVRLWRRSSSNQERQVQVVFASGLDVGGTRMLPFLAALPGWKVIGKGMQTPQVLLDHQVFEEDHALVCNFDFVEAAFPPGMLDEFVVQHAQLVAELVRGSSLLTSSQSMALAPPLLAARDAANRTARPATTSHVWERFIENARTHASAPVLLGAAEAICYGQAAALVARQGRALRARVDGAPLVGLLAAKGVAQYLAALSIVEAGTAYVPLNIDWPPARIASLLRKSGARFVVADERGAAILGPSQATVIRLEEIVAATARDCTCSPSLTRTPAGGELAYVIFTSGSTGEPKGVAIPHAGLANTVSDVADRFGFGANDRILSVSELNFDLSAFDLFGAIHAGAAVVVPDHDRRTDPAHWEELIESRRITVWNSVPALAQMLLDHLGPRAAVCLRGLRLAMLSGDWIPMGLPGRLRAAAPGIEIVALGGATEASIWSNYHRIESIDPTWKSIPYGLPLANQTLEVLDDDLQPAPTWVPGELYIGGAGLATGYHNDPTLTAGRFVARPGSTTRLYRTGDRARHWADGTVELLGRVDRQVKLRGFRLDLLEIEKEILACPGVGQAMCLVDGEGATQTLRAFVVPSTGGLIEEWEIRRRLEAVLPAYAVPASFLRLEALPLTGNGKRDEEALRALARTARTHVRSSAQTCSRAETRIERELLEIWRDLCEVEVTSVDADFFDMGGTSLLAVQLLARIRERFGIGLALSSILRGRTVAAQARLIAAPGVADRHQPSAIVTLRAAGDPAIVLVHPVGGHVLGYRSLVARLPPSMSVYGVQTPPDVPAREALSTLAGRYVGELVQLARVRTIHLAGWSMGGVIATEVARGLVVAGCPAHSLTLIDSFVRAPGAPTHLEDSEALRAFFGDFLAGTLAINRSAPLLETSDFERAVARLHDTGHLPAGLGASELFQPFATFRAHYDRLLQHRFSVFPLSCPTTILHARDTGAGFSHLVPVHGHLKDGLESPLISQVIAFPGDHYALLDDRRVGAIADALTQHISVSSSPPAPPLNLNREIDS